MTAVPFAKKELQAQIDTINSHISTIKTRQVITIDEHEANRIDLQKLEALRSELLDKIKSAPDN